MSVCNSLPILVQHDQRRQIVQFLYSLFYVNMFMAKHVVYIGECPMCIDDFYPFFPKDVKTYIYINLLSYTKPLSSIYFHKVSMSLLSFSLIGLLMCDSMVLQSPMIIVFIQMSFFFTCQNQFQAFCCPHPQVIYMFRRVISSLFPHPLIINKFPYLSYNLFPPYNPFKPRACII